MDKYKNGKIYTIRCKNDDSLIYVGSTVQPLFKRWYEHKHDSKLENNILLYQKIKETNVDDWYIELYENFPCNNREELNKREGEVIRQIGTLNKNIAGRTPKEYIKQWTVDNKEKISQKKKEYRQRNKELITQKNKDYYEANKDTLLEKYKQYNEANKDKIKDYKKEYYQRKKQEQ